MAPSEPRPEFHVWEGEPSRAELDHCIRTWSRHLVGRRLLDVGCGEGHVLAALRRAGHEIEGVESNDELASRARAKGHTVHTTDAASFIEAEGHRFQGFLLIDFIEHVPFDAASRILGAMSPGSVCVIQTPNTNSVAGHQFYLQVPGHVAPYSPTVLDRMLQRAGMEILDKGTVYGGLPWRGLRRRLTEFLLVKVVGLVTARLLIEGANYYVVATKRPAGSFPSKLGDDHR